MLLIWGILRDCIIRLQMLKSTMLIFIRMILSQLNTNWLVIFTFVPYSQWQYVISRKFDDTTVDSTYKFGFNRVISLSKLCTYTCALANQAMHPIAVGKLVPAICRG